MIIPTGARIEKNSAKRKEAERRKRSLRNYRRKAWGRSIVLSFLWQRMMAIVRLLLDPIAVDNCILAQFRYRRNPGTF